MKKTDREAEIKRLLPEAHQGYFVAQFELGMTYMRAENWEDAYFWLSLATTKAQDFGVSAHLTSEQIAAVDQRVTGWNPTPDPEAVQSLSVLRSKADGGDANAQFELGTKCKQGIKKHAKAAGQGDLAWNWAEAVNWWRLAAEQGLMDAQFQLGEAFSKGLGVKPDYAEALKWYRKAAEQGNVEAQKNVSLLLAHGYGVPQK